MAIQLQDINAGDTIQGMVQKINYNFDQIQANGGGPQGIQGEQGDRGETGPRGAQGEQGQRGSMWFVTDGGSYTAPDGYDPTENDICISSEGEISIYGDNGWQDTGINIVANIDSPFVTDESNNVKRIQARTDYEEYIFGLGNDVNSIEQIPTKPSIAICVNTEQSATSHADGIEMYDSLFAPQTYIGGLKGNGTGMRLESNGEIKLTAGGVSGSSTASHSLILSNAGKTMTWTALENVAPANEFPFIVAKPNGEITPYSGGIYNTYGWSIMSYKFGIGSIFFTSIAPNRESGYVEFNIGYPTRRIDKIYTGDENYGGLIVGHQPNNDKYGIMITNTRNSLTGSGVNSVGIHKNGITIGDISNSISADGKNNMMKGISINDYESYGGCISFGVNNTTSIKPEYIYQINSTTITDATRYNYSNAEVSIATGLSYNTNLAIGSQYGQGALITVNQPNPESRDSDTYKTQIKLVGANGRKGGSVVISGGRAYTTTSSPSSDNVTYRGGDVYISGGDAVEKNPESYSYNDTLIMRPMSFGDVIIGINPDNHRQYYTSLRGTNINNDRGANTHTGYSQNQIEGFYDINNFIAHANCITLDSNAQDMIFRPQLYNNTGAKYPSCEALNNITFNVGGMCTLNHYEPIVISNDKRIYMYQMLSGKMCYIYELYDNGNDYIANYLWGNGARNTPIKKNRAYSMAVTEWIKIGNIVQCSTKITNYFTKPFLETLTINILYGGYSYASQTGVHFIDEPSKYIIPIRLPIYIAGQTKVNCVNGTGTVFVERQGNTNAANPNIPADVTPIHCIFDGINYYPKTNQYNGYFNNGRHYGGGDVNSYSLGSDVQGHYYPEDYCKGTFSHNNDTSGEDDYKWFAPETTVRQTPFIIPDTIYHNADKTLQPNNQNSEVHTVLPLCTLYTTGTFNYTYVLNPSFSENVYSPFCYYKTINSINFNAALTQQ